ncbi:MAG: UbiA prenyltransferase family protein [Candidatus Methanospirareceae archaeon]
MGLTAIAPVMGALSMQCYDLCHLMVLFLIGFFSHACGFILNDIIDYDIDKWVREIRSRPLVSGTVSFTEAWILVSISALMVFSLGFFLAFITGKFFPLLIMFFFAICAVIYDLTSKKLPLMDTFLAMAIFFLILYGATTVSGNLKNLSPLAWIIATLGALQLFFMQLIGQLKDIENDYKCGMKTLAIKMGVRVVDKKLLIPPNFKILGYALQILFISIAFSSFVIVNNLINVGIIIYPQLTLLTLTSIFVIGFCRKFFTLDTFNRKTIRRLVGLHHYTNFTFAPLVLIGLNPWISIVIFIPLLIYVLSNLILYNTLMEPKAI